jgi:hypothetical protein
LFFYWRWPGLSGHNGKTHFAAWLPARQQTVRLRAVGKRAAGNGWKLFRE